MILLRPFLLGYKHRLLSRGKRVPFFNFEFLIVVCAIGLMYGMYLGLHLSLRIVSMNPMYGTLLPGRILSLMFLAFFALLVFSNFIAALSCIFTAKDLPLLLPSPVTRHQLFSSRVAEVILTSSWMFAFFGIPIALAYYTAFDLSPLFLVTALGVGALFLLIPAALGALLAVLFINVFSLARLSECIALGAVLFAGALLIGGQRFGVEIPVDGNRLKELGRTLAIIRDPNPYWLPSRWASDTLESFVRGAPQAALRPFLNLALMAAGTYAVSFLAFYKLFFRGWSRGFEMIRPVRAHGVQRSGGTRAFRYFPFDAQQRAIMAKEYRSFLRDTAQALQLVLILLLTMLYLYNFHSLRGLSKLEGEFQQWWQVILAVANIAMGSCVTAAIATRFVFPSISLEGQSYTLLRSAPLTVKNFLWGKFVAWLIPVVILSSVLLLSGAFALQASPLIISQTLFAGVALSIGVVGLGVGVGAVYARFDWDSPSQVTSSFGGLVYMVLSLMTTFVTLIPVSYLMVTTSVPAFLSNMGPGNFMLSLGCAVFLIIFVNLAVSRRALLAGEDTLLDRER